MKKFWVCISLAFFCTGFYPEGNLSASMTNEAPGPIIGGVSDENGNVVAGVKVQIFSCDEQHLAGETRTDPAGRYVLSPPAAGCYQLRFSGEGYESSWYGEPPIRDNANRITIAGQGVEEIDAMVSSAGSAISGRVRTEKGEPLAAAWVAAIRFERDSFSVSDGRTGEDGTFSVDVRPGPYLVVFSRPGYVTGIYGDSLTDPQMVEAVDGRTTGGIEGLLAPGGRISGIVTDEKGEGISGIQVGVVEGGFPVGDLTDEEGRFLIDGLPAGSHRLIFVDPEERYQRQGAKPVAVKVLETTAGIKAVLKAAGGISGWVTDESGNGIPGVRVFAQPVDGEASFGMAATGESGEYTVSGLASGTYHLFFRSPDPSYLPSFFPGTYQREEALPVAVTAPRVTYGVDLAMSRGSALSGRVLGPAGEPVPGVFVSAHFAGREAAQVPAFAVSEPDGGFALGLPPGEYLVEFRGPDGYLTRWTGGAAERGEAEPVVIDPEAPAALEMILPLGGVLSGTARNRAGAPIAGIRVRAIDVSSGERSGSAVTEEDGTYRIQGLESGRFSVIASGSDVGYVQERFPGTLEITAPEEIARIDFVMTRGGALEGRVTAEDSTPLQGVDVEVFDPRTWQEIADAETDESGSYWVGGLPVGSYAIRFEKEGYAVQWYRGKARRKDAATVGLTGTATRSGVNAVMSQGVSLAGTVRSTSGVSLPHAEVGVYGSIEDEPVDEVRTGFDGSFSFENLSPGSYRVRFGHPDHIPEWHGGRHRHDATPIVIGDAGSAPLTVSLTMSGVKVSGKLINTDGEDVGEAWMTVIDSASGEPVADERICECSGKFDIPLPAGKYKLKVERHGQVVWYGERDTGQAAELAVEGNLSGLEMIIGEALPRAD